MNLKKTYAFMLFFILVLNCSVVSAGATMTADSNIVINRASRRINCTIPANTAQAIDIRIYLDKDETVTYDCTYSPKLPSIDFGVAAPDGLFTPWVVQMGVLIRSRASIYWLSAITKTMPWQ